MPAVNVLTLHNGTAAVTFVPSEGRYTEQGLNWQEYLESNSALAPLLRGRIRVGFRQPKNGKPGKLEVHILHPTAETITGSSDQGYTAPAKRAYIDPIRVSMDVNERSSTTSRAIPLAYLNRLFAQGAAVAANDFVLTGHVNISPNAIGSLIYRNLEGLY